MKKWLVGFVLAVLLIGGSLSAPMASQEDPGEPGIGSVELAAKDPGEPGIGSVKLAAKDPGEPGIGDVEPFSVQDPGEPGIG
ncbi:hypothetical protein EQV77_15295 [Halobacillus fulvus]|nr:hypothetical protein EQV77_15295 [Halobacillus fulvus]